MSDQTPEPTLRPSFSRNDTDAVPHEHKDAKTVASDPEQPAHLYDEEKPLTPEEEKSRGVMKIEALYLVFGRGWKLWSLWASIGVISFVYALSESTTYYYLAFATSSYGEHTILGTISTITAIMGGVAQPFIAKFSDLVSRPWALALSVLFYAVGYAIVAGSSDVTAVAAGEVIYTIGNTGINLLTGLLIADITSLQWRGTVQGLFSLPFVITAFVAGDIADGIGAYTGNGWRWGYGMFCITVPVCLGPTILVLFWGDWRAKKLGALSLASSSYARRQALAGREVVHRTFLQNIIHYGRQINAIGLLLLGFAFACLLAPATLSSTATNGYKNPSLIAMYTVGGILFIVFCMWEWKFSSHPIMRKRVLNRTFLCCVVIDFMYYLSGYLSLTYYSSWVYIIKPQWSAQNYTYFNNILTVGLCVFGVLAGVIMRYTHRYKIMQLCGLGIRIIGSGLNFAAVNGNDSDAMLVMGQILCSLGGGFSVIASQVASQGSVPHQDLAIAIAILALWTSIGGSIGSAISASVWNRTVPANLAKYLGDTYNSTELAAMFGDITIAAAAEPHDLVIKAYNEAVWPLWLASLITCFIPLIAGLLTTNYYLGSTHNAIESVEIKMLPEDETREEVLREKVHAAEERAKQELGVATY